MKPFKSVLLSAIMLPLFLVLVLQLVVNDTAALNSGSLTGPEESYTAESPSRSVHNTTPWGIISSISRFTALVGQPTISSTDVYILSSVEPRIVAASRPVEGVSINGPATGDLGIEYNFTAIVTPQDASPPIRYVWSPAPVKGQRRQTATYVWNSPGKYEVMVTAYNKTGSATDSQKITIGPAVPINSVEISGPTSAIVNETSTFNASVTPSDANQPITYFWSPGPSSGQNTSKAKYKWTSPGTKTIKVTATNDVNSKMATRTINVTSILLTDVRIDGPITGTKNFTSSFSAIITPINATVPVTYTWSPTPASGQFSNNVVYSWQTAGPTTVTVVAENIGNSKSANHGVLISPEPQPVTDVDIDGPHTGVISVVYSFRAFPAPSDAAEPITLDWTPDPDNGDGSNPAKYHWENPGQYTITVKASNQTSLYGFGNATEQHFIDIKAGMVQLPIILNRWPPVPDVPQLNPIPDPGNGHDYVLTWNGTYLAETYIVVEDTNSNFPDPIEVCHGGQTSCSIDRSGPSRYFYRIKACNSWGCSGWSNAISVHLRWELEPNTYIYQANGPLLSGYDYYGHPDPNSAGSPEPWDCFYILTSNYGQITIDLLNHAGQDTQLLLYYQSLTDLKGRDFAPPYHIEYVGAAGQYFICTFSVGGNTEVVYTLRITYPYPPSD